MVSPQEAMATRGTLVLLASLPCMALVSLHCGLYRPPETSRLSLGVRSFRQGYLHKRHKFPAQSRHAAADWRRRKTLAPLEAGGWGGWDDGSDDAGGRVPSKFPWEQFHWRNSPGNKPSRDRTREEEGPPLGQNPRENSRRSEPRRVDRGAQNGAWQEDDDEDMGPGWLEDDGRPEGMREPRRYEGDYREERGQGTSAGSGPGWDVEWFSKRRAKQKGGFFAMVQK
ncbi:unnamed protein product [Discosporangium mesarthrocarpum]